MPKAFFPNALRALVGFPLGVVLTLAIITVVQVLSGGDAYAVKALIWKDWFWNNEPTFMFAMLGGAFGFVWGAGAIFDFETVHTSEETGLALSSGRIPVDPDAPRFSQNPATTLIEAIPAIGYAFIIIILSAAWLYAVIVLKQIPWGFTFIALIAISYILRSFGEKITLPNTGTAILLGLLVAFGFGIDLDILPNVLPSEATVQTTNDAAQPSEFGETSYNILGLIELENVNQATLFLGFSLIVLFSILLIATTIAIALNLLNRLVNTVQVAPAEPIPNDILPMRIAAFFTEWGVDMLDSVGGMFRPR